MVAACGGTRWPNLVGCRFSMFAVGAFAFRDCPKATAADCTSKGRKLAILEGGSSQLCRIVPRHISSDTGNWVCSRRSSASHRAGSERRLLAQRGERTAFPQLDIDRGWLGDMPAPMYPPVAGKFTFLRPPTVDGLSASRLGPPLLAQSTPLLELGLR